MGSDIVARLRVWSDWLNERCPDTEVRNDLRAAADEIERLRKERDDAEPLLNELWERRTQSTEMRAEIERLRRDYSCICNEMRRMTEERDEAKAEAIRSDLRMADAEFERDEARRLLKAVVDMMRDNMAHDATHPHHLCDFIHRPDIGMCKVCEDWTDAMVMCYPDDFQDEEDGK